MSIKNKKSSGVSPRYDRLRRSLARIGFVCKGSMIKRHMPCGRSGCRCAAGPKHWHGPYFQWSWKVKGKTVSVRLTASQAKLMTGYVINDRRLRRVVAQMRALSLKVVKAELNAAAKRL